MELVAAGKFTRTFGKEGEVIAVLYDRFPEKYDKKEPLYVRLDGLEVPFFISRFQRRGRSGALMILDDIDNELRAGIILGQEFFINSTSAGEPAGNENGLSQFTGYTAVLVEEGNGPGSEITGLITGITGNDANPLFVIGSDGREILIPAAEDMITGIDPEKRILWLELPEGLIDL